MTRTSLLFSSSGWCSLYLCLWDLFFQLVQAVPVPMESVLSSCVGVTCDYWVYWCCWGGTFERRLLFFQLVQVVLVPLGAVALVSDGWPEGG